LLRQIFRHFAIYDITAIAATPPPFSICYFFILLRLPLSLVVLFSLLPDTAIFIVDTPAFSRHIFAAIADDFRREEADTLATPLMPALSPTCCRRRRQPMLLLPFSSMLSSSSDFAAATPADYADFYAAAICRLPFRHCDATRDACARANAYAMR
jgi:hypothetical protein